MPEMHLIPAPTALRGVVENLMHLYLYDFSEYTGDDVDAEGRYTDEYLPRYWSEEGRFPFLVQVDGKWAGFVLVRRVSEEGEIPITHSIAEFFILRKYRGQKIGRKAAWEAFDRFPGRWLVGEILDNLPAQAFWRRIIGEYTAGHYKEVTLAGWDGPTQEFFNIRAGDP